MCNYNFPYNKRLGISIPVLNSAWEDYSEAERADILHKWEKIRGSIPDRIKEFEAVINEKQSRLNKEENFKLSCSLNSEIAEIASRINDLHLWYRLNQEFDTDKSHQ
jgi:hypothetical protein